MRKSEMLRFLLAFVLVYSLARAQDFTFHNLQVNGSISGAGASPAGTLRIITTGTCGTGWTENSAMDGKIIIGTLAANGNVGSTGGNDSITPTVASLTAAAQVFSGTPFSNVINHTHAVTVTYNAQGGTTAATTGTHSMTSTATGGSARALTSGDVVSATTANPAGGVASITPAGTNAASSVSGTLNSFDNRPAFVRVIFCVKA